MIDEKVFQLLIQFPVIGAVFLAVYFIMRQMRSQHREHRQELDRTQARFRESIDALKDHFDLIGSRARDDFSANLEQTRREHRDELDRFAKLHGQHIASLRAEIRHLRERLKGTSE